VAIDWDRYDEADADSAADADAEEPYEGNEEVRRLDSAGLDEARKNYDFIALDVAFPWCTKCRWVVIKELRSVTRRHAVPVMRRGRP
jgi:hypothetical protein